MVATITPLEIDDWLNALTNKQGEMHSPQSRGNYARVLSVAFGYAVRRHYASVDPLAGIQKATSGSRPEILSVEQMIALLDAASSDILPYIAIGAFAGLRAASFERLDWRDILTLKKTKLL